MKEIQISARVEEPLRDSLQKIADRNERSFSQEVRRALRLHVLKENVKKAAA